MGTGHVLVNKHLQNVSLVLDALGSEPVETVKTWASPQEACSYFPARGSS